MFTSFVNLLGMDAKYPLNIFDSTFKVPPPEIQKFSNNCCCLPIIGHNARVYLFLVSLWAVLWSGFFCLFVYFKRKIVRINHLCPPKLRFFSFPSTSKSGGILEMTFISLFDIDTS